VSLLGTLTRMVKRECRSTRVAIPSCAWQAGRPWVAEPTSRPDDRLHWLDTLAARRDVRPPGLPSTQLARVLWRSHESTNPPQCLVRCLPARPTLAFAANGDEHSERSRRAAITGTESSHDPCRRRVQSHATTRPPSNGAICRPSAPQRAHTVFLVSSTPPPNQIVLHRPVETAGVFGNFVCPGLQTDPLSTLCFSATLNPVQAAG
jgi:hypothetical protein